MSNSDPYKEIARSSKILLPIYQYTRCLIHDTKLHVCKNLKYPTILSNIVFLPTCYLLGAHIMYMDNNRSR
jgi:hypothetical protein